MSILKRLAMGVYKTGIVASMAMGAGEGINEAKARVNNAKKYVGTINNLDYRSSISFGACEGATIGAFSGFCWPIIVTGIAVDYLMYSKFPK